MIKFKCLVNDEYEEVVAYNDIVDYIEADETQSGIWTYEELLAHQGPLHSSHKDYNGSKYNIQIRWSTGEVTWEPLENLAGPDRVCAAQYARDHDLLDEPG